jgi:NarL family two-component system response regulator LiaR
MNVLLIDDHPMVSSGLASILEETGRFKVTGQVNSLAQAKNFFNGRKKTLPSLVILDILLGEENGLDFLPFLESYCIDKKIQKPPVLVCSVMEEPFRIQSALKMGALGYIPKTSDKTELLEAIDSVLRKEVFIPSEYSSKINKTFGLYAKFTKREMEIYSLIKEKKSNKQIAEELGLNFRTVENHVSNIYFKTGASSREELIKL